MQGLCFSSRQPAEPRGLPEGGQPPPAPFTDEDTEAGRGGGTPNSNPVLGPLSLRPQSGEDRRKGGEVEQGMGTPPTVPESQDPLAAWQGCAASLRLQGTGRQSHEWVCFSCH